MAARRQPSTTSLSRYARTSSPLQHKSSDFCNAFWGLADGGVDVLFARMRGAQRSMDELRNYWKERAIIEEDYAKRLAKLSKVTLGRDEIGELRNSFDTLRLETDKQATSHLNLANQIRELEGQSATFLNKQVHHKKVYQGSVEKAFKAKQTQESYVNKAREKYEADCIRINSYTAQSTLMQGKDLDKIRLKLERSQQTVQSNERDFANFAKALADTTHKWEQDWKVFCDLCQDLEEDRMEFMKDNMWAYANAISSVCVSDDESCEKVRVALEQMDPEKEMENFVRDYGTGPQIPDPPPFINYAAPDAVPSAATRPTTHPARYTRNTNRPAKAAPPPVEDEEPIQNTAGVGAGGNWKDVQPEEQPLTRQPTQSRGRSQSISQAGNQARSSVNGTHTREGGSAETNGTHAYRNAQSRPSSVSPHPPPQQQSQQSQPQSQSQSQQQTSAQSSLSRRPTSVSAPRQGEPSRIPHDPLADPIDPRAETFIKVGDNAYRVDLSRDPQQASGMSPKRNDTAGPSRQSLATPGDTEDPLAKQMKELQRAVSTSGSVRRKSVVASQSSPQKPTTMAGPSSSLSAPGTSRQMQTPSPANSSISHQPQQIRDYRMSAESVVGSYPPASVSRAPSPKPPTAEFMKPQHSGQRPGSDHVDAVVADYEQSLPGERKSVSRRGSYIGPSPSQFGATQPNHPASTQGQSLTRPPSQVGHAGIGAHGSRSPSPQPMMQGPSPTPSPSRGGYVPPNQNLGMGHPMPQNHRAVSPNNVGIALDPSGRVLHDEMANRYQQPRQPSMQQQQQQQQPPPQQQQPLHQQPTGYNAQPRRTSYMAPTHTGMVPPPPPNQQPQYGAPGPQPQQYVPPPPPLTYQQPAQQQQPSYGSLQHIPPQPTYTPAPYQQQQPMQQYQPPMGGGYGSGSMGSIGRNMSLGAGAGGGYYNAPINGVPQQQQQQQQGLRQPQQQQPYREPSPAMAPPQPAAPPGPGQVTGQTTEDGKPILFYVQTLYDYSATIDEEFDFQAGDIIAVTATPEDGWWSGELLDETRRRRGQHIFPSNFVRLF
ncbi:hypothetical protein ONZ45_g9509 [Pleurotus djamor]|nr:hypothetical protein ONZ45_g9509 [Pleurotus djamor]